MKLKCATNVGTRLISSAGCSAQTSQLRKSIEYCTNGPGIGLRAHVYVSSVAVFKIARPASYRSIHAHAAGCTPRSNSLVPSNIQREKSLGSKPGIRPLSTENTAEQNHFVFRYVQKFSQKWVMLNEQIFIKRTQIQDEDL